MVTSVALPMALYKYVYDYDYMIMIFTDKHSRPITIPHWLSLGQHRTLTHCYQTFTYRQNNASVSQQVGMCAIDYFYFGFDFFFKLRLASEW